MPLKKRRCFDELYRRIEEQRPFIQVLLGPRQVGKTTMALQLSEALDRPFHYASADPATLQDLTWLQQQWEVAREKATKRHGVLLIIDEVQKIPHWSDLIKKLWDQDTRDKRNVSVLILGSYPWLMQRGLSESLAGRYEIIPVPHWSFAEMRDNFGWSLDRYLYFGGYPGAAPLVNERDVTRWTNYIADSLIETTVSRDILLMTRVDKSALLRRLFQLGCSYSGQTLSYQKLLGQLQDVGNTTTLAHYLELLAGAGLVCGLQKFAMQSVRRRSSSPKFAVYNTALLAAQSALTFQQAKKDRAFWGRLVESAVGAHLLNGIRGTQIELTYWREGDKEVDFVLRHGRSLTAIEVKSNHAVVNRRGMDLFVKKFDPKRILIVGGDGMPIKDFLCTEVTQLVS